MGDISESPSIIHFILIEIIYLLFMMIVSFFSFNCPFFSVNFGPSQGDWLCNRVAL
jgi:hypothetical protein